MSVSHHVDHSTGILLVKRGGQVTAEEDRDNFEARLADPQAIEGMPVLVDAAEIEPADSVERIRCMAERVTLNTGPLKCGPVAILVASDVEFGMARMSMALTAKVHSQINVFRTREETLAWLQSAKSRPDVRPGQFP